MVEMTSCAPVRALRITGIRTDATSCRAHTANEPSRDNIEVGGQPIRRRRSLPVASVRRAQGS